MVHDFLPWRGLLRDILETFFKAFFVSPLCGSSFHGSDTIDKDFIIGGPHLNATTGLRGMAN